MSSAASTTAWAKRAIIGLTIPLGVATTLLVAALLRAALSDHLWDEIGGFALAGMVAATLVLALASSR